MLVLTRKPGETICIGPDIELVVLDAGRGRVKLGFAGPRNIPIRRGELGAEVSTPSIENSHIVNRPTSSVPGYAPLRSFLPLARSP